MKARIITNTILIAIIALIIYILAIPVNMHQITFWLEITGIVTVVIWVNHWITAIEHEYWNDVIDYKLVIPFIILIIMMILGIASSPLFNANRYSRLISVETCSADTIPEINNQLPLMDTASAQVLGSKELGVLTDLAGQFTDDTYRQINYENSIKVFAPLRYRGFFKWLNQKLNGIPGYVIVDTASQSAEYRNAEQAMHIAPAGYFNDDAKRYLWLTYPTKIYRNIHVEPDDEGTLYIIAPYVKRTIGVFGGTVIDGAVLVNTHTGAVQDYKSDNIPEWVDVIWDGDLLSELYNCYGKYQRGFWNSIFGQVGCTVVTDDYGYIADKNDVMMFTGVTSLAAEDQSNVGFIIANERTGEMKYTAIPGSNESSAMSAAMGEVQEKEYIASFPTLAMLDDKPVYVSILKDNAGYVKMFAVIDAEQANNVAVASTKDDAIKAFKKKYILSDKNPSQESETSEEVLITNAEFVSENGTVLIITTKDGQVLKYRFD